MSLNKILSTNLLLLLLAFCCSTTTSQPPPSPRPRPSPFTQPILPKEEVDAVNALLRLSEMPRNRSFSSADCDDSSQFKKSITCNCNSTYCAVIKITLPSSRLTGNIPYEIRLLSQLRYLDLSQNKLSGPIPSSFAYLSQLETLDLCQNELSGPIPSSFAYLSKLEKLFLYNNKLGGHLPQFIRKLKSLRHLDLGKNKLSGPIPMPFVHLSVLEILYLDSNNLGGPLPLFISKMKSLRVLYLVSNGFNESIPREFGILPSLEVLSLSDNLLSGSIPVELANISSLVELNLDDNLLTGQLPPDLGNFSRLESMDVSNNEFSGALPSEFGKLESITYFNIQGDGIGGTIPASISNWRSLDVLVLIGNNFEGTLPNISTLINLQNLEVNSLPGSPDGSLFPELSNARNLEALTLRHCSLVGSIPDYIWKFPNLKYLDLSFNNLTGRIPPVVPKQTILEYIYLGGNRLNGLLPGWTLNSKKSFVDVSENLFSSAIIPGTKYSNRTNLFNCCSNNSWQEVDYDCASKTQRYDSLHINCGGDRTYDTNGSLYEADLNPDGASTFFLSSNKAWAYSSMGISSFTSSSKYELNESCIRVEDPELYLTARLSPTSLKYYGFCLKDNEYIVRLHFAEIGWKRTDVRDPGTKRRRVFDVEIQDKKIRTDFNIEKEAGGIERPTIIEHRTHVSRSRPLVIHLYWSGKGTTAYPTTNVGPLISAISVFPAPKKHKKLFPVVISTIVGSVLLFGLMILALCWKFGWLGGKRPNGVELYPGGVFNFQQIKAATNNFAPDKKIGQGGFGDVYRGTLPNGTEIAVKQLSRKSKQGVPEFINEMGTIYALKHPNLVKLMGCCAEEQHLLLVYEHMENNSLGNVLFGPEEEKAKLDWKKRVKICLDVAKGLSYLHEECGLKLIHGDIKPTNILLDKDFNAKISDFGFARPDVTSKKAQSDGVNTQVKGTQGYIAPECMKAYYSPKADVYSYGILTLEIISGKPSSTPSSKGQTVYLLDMAYDYLRKGNPVGLIDPSLGSDYNHKEAKVIICLAMKCINYDPDQRPIMSEVVKILEGKEKIENVLVPIDVDDLMKGKAAVASSETTAGTSYDGTSDTTVSPPTSKEIDDSGGPSA